MRKNKQQNNTGGFVILYAVLVVGLALSVGLTIFTISYKENMLHDLNRHSLSIFNSAEQAADCYFYWDLNYDAFSGPTTTYECASDRRGVDYNPHGRSKGRNRRGNFSDYINYNTGQGRHVGHTTAFVELSRRGNETTITSIAWNNWNTDYNIRYRIVRAVKITYRVTGRGENREISNVRREEF